MILYSNWNHGIHGFVAILLAIGLSATASAATPACDAKVLASIDTTAEQRVACAGAFASNPPPESSAESDALYLSLGAIETASFTRPSSEGLAAARKTLEELDRRKTSRPADRRAWRDILLLNGDVDEAEAYETAHPGHDDPTLPARQHLGGARHPGTARYWLWDNERNLIREREVDLSEGIHLVIDASPGCHFCPLAATAISRDPQLEKLFQGALWISRPEQGLDPAYYRRWNNSHPAEQMVVVLDVQGWDVPAQWSTPVFRFFRDGQVVATVMGWTNGSAAKLLNTGRSLGMPGN